MMEYYSTIKKNEIMPFAAKRVGLGAFLVAQTVKNLPAMQENQVPSLSWEDPLEKGMKTHFSILAWRMPWAEEPGDYSPKGHKESDTTEATKHAHTD